MPTYRYRCAKCGDETEVWQSFDEKPKTRHAGGCGGKLQKVMSPAGIVLKGSGFYKTDNRSSKSGAKANGKDSSSTDSIELGVEVVGLLVEERLVVVEERLVVGFLEQEGDRELVELEGLLNALA